MADNFNFPGLDNSNTEDPYLLPRVRDIIYGAQLPDPKPVNVDINRNIAGSYATGPEPGLKNGQNGMGESILSYMRQADTWAYDKNRFAKTYDYGADWKHANFDRYYNSRAFKDLKFSPYRDNEEHYNNNTSAWDDFLRAGSGALKLFGHGFIAMEEGADSAAEAMERVNKVYGSTRKGIGGFMSNLVLSAGYTQGIVARIALEELALAAATVGSLGTASEVTIPAMAARGVEAGMALGRVGKYLKNTLNTFKNLDNIDVARKVWDAAKNIPRGVGKFVAPQTMEFGANILKGANAAQEFKDLKNYAKVFKGVGSMYSDYRQFRLAYSEAAMEGKMLETKLNEDLINEYYAKNGKMPEGKDAEDIYQRAIHAGGMNTMWNSALIYGSNKIVFGKLFKGIPSAGQMLGKFVSAPVGELKKLPYKVGQNFYDFAKKDLGKKIAGAVFTSSYSPLSRKYMLENFTEGFQEFAQDSFAEGFEQYYKDIKSHPSQSNFIDMLDSISRASGKNFSQKGFETFMSGYLMSTLVQPAMGFITETMPTYGRKFVPGALREKWGMTSYEDMMAAREESKNRVLESINKVVADPYKMNTSGADYMAEVSNHAKKIREAEDSGDANRIKDARSEMYFDHLYRVIETGHMDQLKDYFKSMDKLSDEELSEAMNRPVEEVADIRKQLKEAEKNAANFQKIYETQNNLFPDFYDETKFRKGTPEYEAAQRGNYSFRQAKKFAMFANYAFIDATERMSEEMDAFSNSKPLSKTSANDLMMFFDPVQMDKQVEVLKNEAAILMRGSKEDKAKAEQKTALADKLDRFVSNVNFYLQTQTEEKTAKRKSKLQPTVEEEFKPMTVGATVVNSKGQEFIITDVKGSKLKLKDKQGKNYSRNNRRGLKVVKPGKEGSTMFDVRDSEGLAMAELYSSYKTLLKQFADTNDEMLFDSKVDESFTRIRDFYNLKNDSRAMGQVVNQLHNPENLFNLAMRMDKSLASIKDKQKEYLQEAVKIDEDIKDHNALLNDLFDSALKLTPDGVRAILNKEMPNEFLDESTGQYVNATEGTEKYEEGLRKVKFHLNIQELKKKQDEERKAKAAEEQLKTKVEGEPEVKPTEKKEVTPPPAAPIKPAKKIVEKIKAGTSYDDIDDVDFKKQLVNSARLVNQTRSYEFFDEDSSEDDITATDWFNNTFMKSAHVKNMIEKRNKEVGFKEAEEPPTSTKLGTFVSGEVPEEVAARIDLVSKFGLDQAAVDKMTTPQVLEEYARLSKAPISTDAKADIEKNKKADLEQLKTISPANYIKVKGTAKDLLKKFREYLTDVLGWERMPIGFSNGNLTLDYLGTELKIPAAINVLAGGTAFIDISIEDVIEAKYNAELAALGKPESTSKGFIADYEQTKREKPALDIEPGIIYSTASTGKTSLSEKYSNVIDADFILYKYLVDKGVLKPAKTEEQFRKEMQAAGDVFFKWYDSKRQKSLEDAKKLVEDAIRTMKSYKDSGYTVLTSNWFMTYQADKAYLLMDKSRTSDEDDASFQRVAEEFIKRGAVDMETAMQKAKNVMQEERKDFKNRAFTIIKPNEFIGDYILKGPIDPTDTFISKVMLADVDDIETIEEELAKLPQETLDKIDTDKIAEEIKARKQVLSKSFKYDDLKEGDMLIDSNGDIVMIELKLGSSMVVQKINDPEHSVYPIKEEELENKIKARYIPGVKGEALAVEKPENEQEFKNNTINNSQNVSKTDDINAINGANGTNKKITFDGIKPNDCDG